MLAKIPHLVIVLIERNFAMILTGEASWRKFAPKLVDFVRFEKNEK